MSHISEAPKEFLEHKISKALTSRSWKVQKPGTWIYGFTITWSPGVLTLAGDVGELVINHWNAMPTLEETLDWLSGIDFHYLMGKSSAKRQFSLEKSLAQLKGLADEDQRWNDKAPHWKKIFDHFDTYVEAGFGDHLNKEHQAALIAALRDQYTDIGQHDFVELATCSDDYAGEEDWPTQCRWQFEAIMCWCRLMLEQDAAAPARVWSWVADRARAA